MSKDEISKEDLLSIRLGVREWFRETTTDDDGQPFKVDLWQRVVEEIESPATSTQAKKPRFFEGAKEFLNFLFRPRQLALVTAALGCLVLVLSLIHI